MDERAIVVFDEHYPECIPQYFNVRQPNKVTPFEKFVIDFKPTMFGKGGDNLNLDCISHWNNGKVKNVEKARLFKDYDGYEYLRKRQDAILDKTVRKKWWHIGNHEVWVDDVITMFPVIGEGFLEIEHNVKLKENGWSVVPNRKLYDMGGMVTIHGNFKRGYTPEFHARAIAKMYHRHVAYGHFHTEQSFTDISPVEDEKYLCQSVGTMGTVFPEYAKNLPSQHVNSFLIAEKYKGVWNRQIIRVYSWGFSVNGVKYKM